MSLKIGDRAATSGMAAEIYNAIDLALEPPGDHLEELRGTWRLLSWAIAAGVVRYLRRDPPDDDPTGGPGQKLEYAEAFSARLEDEQFWDWLAGFVDVFTAGWTPIPGDGGAALKAALSAHLQSHPRPESLRGIIE